MAPDINSQKNKQPDGRADGQVDSRADGRTDDLMHGVAEDGDDRLFWTSRLSLARRILAVNFFVLALLAGGFFYLDSYRSRLIDSQITQGETEIQLLDDAMQSARPDAVDDLVVDFAIRRGERIRLYDATGKKTLDSFDLAPPTYELRDPETEPFRRHIARFMDQTIDFIVMAPRPLPYVEPQDDTAHSWAVLQGPAGQPESAYMFAPDRTPVLNIGMKLASDNGAVMVTSNAREITRTVRAERFRFGVVLALATLASALLSLFLARTIARPLRRLAISARRVRLGRAREVTVPRLPSRGDEIGMLARALSDMTQALRQRIDAGEHFAADVTHELKNPLASLRSAIEGLERVEQPDLRKQLLDIAADDVRRLDRLVTDISEASRVDAQLSRTRFEVIDLGGMIEAMLAARKARATDDQAKIAFARPRIGVASVMGEASRLERVFDNLFDNAQSFTPTDGLVQISATRVGDNVVIRVDDNGPGVPENQREEIFRRFHSIRPEGEDFGKHSGLGLAIARTIIEAHQGTIVARDRDDGKPGARFEITMPAANCNEAPTS